MNDEEPRIEMLLRATPQNHADTPPECDEACRRRWADMPHGHICPDGLLDMTPFLTITTWCSCGFLLQGPLHLDARVDSFIEASEASGTEAQQAFVEHARAVHAIDVTTDEEWQRRLATGPT
jgi:hypothetical protein